MPYIWMAIALAIAISSGIAGHKIASNACEAGKAQMMRDAEHARQLDENFIKGVDFNSQEVLEALRRFKAAKQTEIIRETQKIEYRCELPADGERLRLDAVAAANRAAAGQLDLSVPPDSGQPGEKPGGTLDSVPRPDSTVR